MLNVFQYHNEPEKIAGHGEQGAIIPDYAYNALTSGHPLQYPKPRLEKVISSSPSLSYRYARWMNKPFPLGEPAIATDITAALPYALDILKSRLPAAEHLFKDHQHHLQTYLEQLVHTRVPELEPIILKNFYLILWYIENVIKDKWPEAEPTIKKVKCVLDEYNDLLVSKGYQPITKD